MADTTAMDTTDSNDNQQPFTTSTDLQQVAQSNNQQQQQQLPTELLFKKKSNFHQNNSSKRNSFLTEAIKKQEATSNLNPNNCNTQQTTNPLHFLQFSSNCLLLATPSQDNNNIDIWDVRQSQKCHSLQLAPNTGVFRSDKIINITSAGMCMDIKWLMPNKINSNSNSNSNSDSSSAFPIICAGHEDGYIRFWDLRFANITDPLISFPLHDNAPITCMDFEESGTKGVSGGANDVINVFSVNYNERSLSIIKQIKLNTAGIGDVKIRTDNKIFASGGWDHSWKKVKPLAILKCHQKSIQNVDFLANSNMLASCSSDKRIALWNIY